MQFTKSAVAAFLFAATASARCPPKHSSPSSSAIASVETISVPTSTYAPVTQAAAATPSTTLSTAIVSTTPSATATATASSSSLTTDEQNALDAHNDARAEVGEAALTWDATLVSGAQEWANTLGARGAGTLEHSTTSEGENLYWQSNSDDPFTAAANAWIAEKSDYAPGTAIPASGDASWMHYSQIIWGSTTKLGMAIADDGSGGVYVVARYDPPGNYIGEVPTDA